MIARVLDFCLRHRAIVVIATAIVVVAGAVSLVRLPFDAFPDTTPVQVTVNTRAPALSAIEVERQITFEVEQALSGLPRLADLRSISKLGLSQVTAVFDDDTDPFVARQIVAERLQRVAVPGGVARPSIAPMTTGVGEVFQYVVRAPGRSPTELRTLHDWIVRPQMRQVPGVAEINSWGGNEKQWHVVVDPDALVQHGITLEDVEGALRRNNANAPGGIVSVGGEAQIVQGVALARDGGDLERTVVTARDGVPILIRDIARVEESHAIRHGAVTADGIGEVVLGLGFSTLGENPHELTHALEAKIREVQPTLPDDVRLDVVYDRNALVDHVIETVQENLLEGALLVVAVLFAFLGSLRAGLVVALAIPLSMLFAFDGMLRFGIAGSLMSLGAIDFGLVVDSSVILVENAERRLAEAAPSRSVVDVVRDAVLEVRRPTLFGELIIAAVYLPVLLLEGAEGKLFRPMAITVVLALVGSMIASITIIPVLASFALRRGRHGSRAEPMLVRKLRAGYRPLLEGALRRRAIVLAVAALLLANAAFVATRLGSEFVPRLREMSLVVNTVRLAGVSLDESVRYGTRIEQRLLEAFPDEIAHVWTRTGTGEIATDPMGLEVSDVFLTLKPPDAWRRAETQDELAAAIAASLDGMPGMRAVISQPIEMRIQEMTSGVRADLGVAVHGDDHEVLRRLADQVAATIESVPGADGVTVEQVTGAPMLVVDVDRERTARHGIDAATVLAVVETLGGRVVGDVVEGQRRFPVAIVLDARFRDDPDRIGTILVAGPGGERVPLSQLADLRIEEAPATIQRQFGQRRILVQANARERDLGSFASDVRRAIEERVDLPDGYHVTYGGEIEHLIRARTRLAIIVPLALLVVLALLLLTYGSIRDALRVFTGVPFAAIGGIAALFLRGMPFSVSAGVGFVALAGVSVLADMVLVSRARALEANGVAPEEAIREAADSRLRPVLMTALVASLGFLPMALNTGIGAEVQRPLATVVIGGIITSTIASLVVLPVLYVVFGRRRTA